MSQCVSVGCDFFASREGMCSSCFRKHCKLIGIPEPRSGNLATSDVKGNSQTRLHSVSTCGGTIQVCLGDLTKCSLDCVVNAANSSMQHASGLSGAIKKKAGQSIQDESTTFVTQYGKVRAGDCMVTRAYALPCKFVIHAVGPFFHGGGKGEDRVLYNAAYNSFKAAKVLGMESVAIPALSSGIFGYPVQLVAGVLIQAAFDFFKDNKDDAKNTVKTISFTNFDNSTCGVFKELLETTFKDYDPVTQASVIDVATSSAVYDAEYANDFKDNPSDVTIPEPGSVYASSSSPSSDSKSSSGDGTSSSSSSSGDGGPNRECAKCCIKTKRIKQLEDELAWYRSTYGPRQP